MSVRELRRLPHTTRSILFPALTVIAGAVPPSHADVVTDWATKATVAAPPGALGERELDDYLKGLSASHDAVEKGARLGALVAQRVVESRAADGATGIDPYRPRTQPGVYVPTESMVSSTWPTMRPIVLERPEQFRPAPRGACESRMGDGLQCHECHAMTGST